MCAFVHIRNYICVGNLAFMFAIASRVTTNAPAFALTMNASSADADVVAKIGAFGSVGEVLLESQHSLAGKVLAHHLVGKVIIIIITTTIIIFIIIW